MDTREKERERGRRPTNAKWAEGARKSRIETKKGRRRQIKMEEGSSTPNREDGSMELGRGASKSEGEGLAKGKMKAASGFREWKRGDFCKDKRVEEELWRSKGTLDRGLYITYTCVCVCVYFK